MKPGGAAVIRREADDKMGPLNQRADMAAVKDQCERLAAQVATLKNELARARRGIASERRGREQLARRLRAEEESRNDVVAKLARAASEAGWPGWEMPGWRQADRAQDDWRELLLRCLHGGHLRLADQWLQNLLDDVNAAYAAGYEDEGRPQWVVT